MSESSLPLDRLSVTPTLCENDQALPTGKHYKTQFCQNALNQLQQFCGTTLMMILVMLTMNESVQSQDINDPTLGVIETEVTYKNENANIIKTGTLSVPQGEGPFPSAILITPSLPADRDGSIGQLKFFKDLAHHLTRQGIAVLRTDDRGVGGSTGNYFTSSMQDSAEDVVCGAEFLQRQDKIGPKKIGVIGWSEGANIGALAATKSKQIAYVIMLAGTGLDYAGAGMGQTEDLGKVYGMTDEQVDKSKENLNAICQIIRTETDAAKKSEKISQIITKAIAEGIPNPIMDYTKATTAQMTMLYSSPWFRSQVTIDHTAVLKKVTVPVLAMSGTLDCILNSERHLPSIKKHLASGGNKDVTTISLKGHNHCFQLAGKGTLEEHLSLNTTMTEETLKQISTWIKDRF
jgi:pimeloyl-ACP methyl ester carboxylesterase